MLTDSLLDVFRPDDLCPGHAPRLGSLLFTNKASQKCRDLETGRKLDVRRK